MLERLLAAIARYEESVACGKSRRRTETVPFLQRRGWTEVGHLWRSPYDPARVVTLSVAMKCERRRDGNTIIALAAIIRENQ